MGNAVHDKGDDQGKRPLVKAQTLLQGQPSIDRERQHQYTHCCEIPTRTV